MSIKKWKNTNLPEKFAGSLRDWIVVKASDELFIKGKIYNDATNFCEDGDIFITPPIIEGGDRAVLTLNGYYRLE
jgi:hypothetical protein